jgi:hypothetical protein
MFAYPARDDATLSDIRRPILVFPVLPLGWSIKLCPDQGERQLLTNSRAQTKEIVLYKAALKPIWTYGIQLWGKASNSNTEILQRFQSKTLRVIPNAPWYINNSWIHEDRQINTVKSEIKKWSEKYLNKLENYPNTLAVNLLDKSECVNRLKRYSVLHLPDRFE